MIYPSKIMHYYWKLDEIKPLWPENSVRTAKAGDRSSGELVLFQLKEIAQPGHFDTRYRVLGCPYMIAMTIWLSECLTSLNDHARVFEMTMEALIDKFDLPENKYHSALTLLEIIDQLR